MSGPFILVVAVVIGVGTLIVWAIMHRARGLRAPADFLPVIRSARRRVLLAVLLSIVVLAVGFILGVSVPPLLGLPVAVAPLLSASAGLLLYGALPPRTAEVGAADPRTASLAPRSPVRTGPRNWLMALLVSSGVFVALIIFCGVTASADDAGRWRAIGFEGGGHSTLASPYPGWYYGVPMAGALAILLACTWFALRRISTTAAFPQRVDAALDQQWRVRSAGVLLRLATGAVLCWLGGVSLMAGIVMNNARIHGETPALWHALAITLAFGGLTVLVTSIVCVFLAVAASTRIAEHATKAELSA